MADTYANFRELARHERAGIDYRIVARGALPSIMVVAPHGGGIEPGTSEVADAAAAGELGFYAFEGLKPRGNGELHITSTRFDEPVCLSLIERSQVVLTIHGEHGQADGPLVFAGGLHQPLRRRIEAALRERGFDVRRHTDPDLQGLDPRNLCNRGQTGRGVQLELSRALRLQMFESLTRQGRTRPRPKFRAFVAALRSVVVARSR
jgi:phage replication-related protein YjqB (UPF0714/DUF867 family)